MDCSKVPGLSSVRNKKFLLNWEGKTSNWTLTGDTYADNCQCLVSQYSIPIDINLSPQFMVVKKRI